MKLIVSVVLALFLSEAAFAQTADPAFQAAAIKVLINQRNTAQNEAAQAEASIDVLNKKMADLQKQVDDFKAKEDTKDTPTAPSK